MSKIIQYPADILKQVAMPVAIDLRYQICPCASFLCEHPHTRLDDMTCETINDLDTAMRTHDGDERQALGVSASQIGVAVRVFVVDKAFLKLDHDVFVNPTIRTSGSSEFKDESCMSFPADVKIKIKRADAVEVHAYDGTGTPFTLNCEGLAAQVIQHEIDHLNGITLYQNATSKGKKDIMQKIAKHLKRRVRRNSKS